MRDAAAGGDRGVAGTGKSTTLTGITRVHQAARRQIVITSTAALAAERLARELADAGVQATAYSTVALGAAINAEQIQLGAATTIVHDEAALASTREQHQLLQAVEASGARLIEVGDPRQSQPVGAGGLWSHLEAATQHAGAHVELTRNQRAQDPADQRDQARFRSGQHEQAIRSYAARKRVHVDPDQARAEDAALDAAHGDRTSRRSTIVIAQTSNEHLDELNARAQAIRAQDGQLQAESLVIPGRPYRLHSGDQVQIRRTIQHAEHGQLRNGTTAQITGIDQGMRQLELQLSGGRRITLDHEQAVRSDLRLAYVQHPFPAQGHTTDTTHLIVAEHATREGSYVALTRARDKTHIYAGNHPSDGQGDVDRLQALAERMGRTEPDLPSIHVPLAHETAIAAQPDRVARQPHSIQEELPPPNGLQERDTIRAERSTSRGPQPAEIHDNRRRPPVHHVTTSREVELLADRHGEAIDREAAIRRWPSTRHSEPESLGVTLDEPKRDRSNRWEP